MAHRSGKRLGDRGERIAAQHLEARGWTIVARNHRKGRKEIDLVARRGEVVAFVEVKSRAGSGFGHPLEAITRRKRREIREVATDWIERFGCPDETYRFDALAVVFSPGSEPRVEHVEDAWMD